MNANTLSIDALFPNIKSIEDPLFIKSTDTTEYIIYVMGDSLVGKSSLCMRFALNEFNLEIKPSRTTECYVKRIKLFDKDIKIVLIDLHSNIKDDLKLCNKINGAVILYDITKTKTFENIEKWINELKTILNERDVHKEIPVLILGNKSDLMFLRNIDSEEATEKAAALNEELKKDESNNCILEYESKEANCIDADLIQNCIKYLIAQIYYNELSEDEKKKCEEMYKEECEKDNNEVNNQEREGTEGKQEEKEGTNDEEVKQEVEVKQEEDKQEEEDKKDDETEGKQDGEKEEGKQGDDKEE